MCFILNGISLEIYSLLGNKFNNKFNNGDYFNVSFLGILNNKNHDDDVVA